ncbi:MAG: hypothetical protein SFT90_05720 [Rickettsiales bacterium]|nr:hypothetical protein [Rickettsiales bacterium]
MRKFSEKIDNFIIKITPEWLKKALLKIINKLPSKYSSWVLNNRFLSICIIYALRGLFLRPSMWAVYASIAAYFSWK